MKTFAALVLAAGVTPAAGDCGWTSTCGPRGCADCRDDGSEGYRQCCGGPSPSPSPGSCGWTSTCGPRGCADCKDDGSAGYRQCCGGPSPSPGGGSAGTTRYWDCSGGACGGEWQGSCPNPGCQFPWGSPKCMPHYAAPRAISHPSGATVFATAAAGDPLWQNGAGCGKCYLLTAPAGGKMIVKVNNQCPGQYNPTCTGPHFDIAVPGFDYGPATVSNVCQTSPRNCDPGVNSGVCAYGAISSCNCNAVSSDPVLQQGCRLFQQLPWGDNPQVQMQETGCPGAAHFLASNASSVVV